MADNVVNIGDFSIAKADRTWDARIGKGVCRHLRIEMDDHGEVVTCRDCGVHVSAYWALKTLAGYWGDAARKQKAAQERLTEEKSAHLHLIAAKKAEQAWRNQKMVPCCPHCGEGISAKDGFGGSMVSKRIDEARREARRNGKGGRADG